MGEPINPFTHIRIDASAVSAVKQKKAVTWGEPGRGPMDTFLLLMAGPLFLASLAGHIYVKLRLGPKVGSDFDDYYHEFEEQHPGFARYAKWSRITLIGAAIGALLLFIAIVI